MELKPEYKQTEIGMIPEDWEVVPLSNLCHSITDGTHYTPRYVPQGVPFFSVENVTANEFERTKFITEAEHETLIRRCKPERGDILMTRIGSVGNTKLIDWDVRASIYVSLALFKLNGRADAEYVYRYSQSTAFVRDVEKRSLLNAVPMKINMADIGAIPIVVPRDIPEQRAIAAALSDADALLTKLDQLIAKKRDLKQATMQQLLTGQTRLPGFSGEWAKKRLAEVLKVRHGKSQQHVEVAGGIYPILATGGEIGRTNTCLYDRPSVLIGRKGTIDKPQFQEKPFWTVDTLFYTEVSSTAHPHFLFYKFLMIDWRSYNEASGVPSLNASTIESIDIVVPPLVEQVAIATVLSDMDVDLATLESRRDKTRALKQGMMQELLTGRIRLV